MTAQPQANLVHAISHEESFEKTTREDIPSCPSAFFVHHLLSPQECDQYSAACVSCTQEHPSVFCNVPKSMNAQLASRIVSHLPKHLPSTDLLLDQNDPLDERWTFSLSPPEQQQQQQQQVAIVIVLSPTGCEQTVLLGPQLEVIKCPRGSALLLLDANSCSPVPLLTEQSNVHMIRIDVHYVKRSAPAALAYNDKPKVTFVNYVPIVLIVVSVLVTLWAYVLNQRR